MKDFLRFAENWEHICSKSNFIKAYLEKRLQDDTTFKTQRKITKSGERAYSRLKKNIMKCCFPSQIQVCPSKPNVDENDTYVERQHFAKSSNSAYLSECSSPLQPLNCFSPMCVISHVVNKAENNRSLTNNVMASIFLIYVY